MPIAAFSHGANSSSPVDPKFRQQRRRDLHCSHDMLRPSSCPSHRFGPWTLFCEPVLATLWFVRVLILCPAFLGPRRGAIQSEWLGFQVLQKATSLQIMLACLPDFRFPGQWRPFPVLMLSPAQMVNEGPLLFLPTWVFNTQSHQFGARRLGQASAAILLQCRREFGVVFFFRVPCFV